MLLKNCLPYPHPPQYFIFLLPANCTFPGSCQHIVKNCVLCCVVHLTCRQKEVLIRENSLLFCKKTFSFMGKKNVIQERSSIFKNILDFLLQ